MRFREIYAGVLDALRRYFFRSVRPSRSQFEFAVTTTCVAGEHAGVGEAQTRPRQRPSLLRATAASPPSLRTLPPGGCSHTAVTSAYAFSTVKLQSRTLETFCEFSALSNKQRIGIIESLRSCINYERIQL